MKKNKKSGNIRKTILDIVPVRRYEEEHNCFEMNDGTYMDLLQIQSKDLVNVSEDEVEFDCLKFAKAYRLYADDIKIVCINFPCDYGTQKRYLEYKMKHTRNEIFKDQLAKKRDELIWLEKNNTTREYYYMLFSKTLEEMDKNRLTFTSSLGTGRGGLVQKMSKERKREVLKRLYNKNTMN